MYVKITETCYALSDNCSDDEKRKSALDKKEEECFAALESY